MRPGGRQLSRIRSKSHADWDREDSRGLRKWPACAAFPSPLEFCLYTYDLCRLRDQRMPRAATRDGIQLYYEEAGTGPAVVFVHEYAADHRTWEPQMRHFARSHRCITFSQRGYPPSDIPNEPEAYLQDRFRDDVVAVMDAL